MILGVHGFNILVHNYFSEEGEQIYHLVLKLLLFNHYRFISDYLHFSKNLKDIKDHMLDYIASCKIFLPQKVTASKENMNL